MSTKPQTRIENGQEFTLIIYTNNGAHEPNCAWYPTENLPWLRSQGNDFQLATEETVTRDVMQVAQQKSPQADSTKAIQRLYEAQQSRIKADIAAAEYRAKAEREKREECRLKGLILAERVVRADARLVVMSRRQAEWSGMAPAVAGGWVAVSLPRAGSSLIALVPGSWTECVRDIDIATVAKIWAEQCLDNDELAEALAKLDSCVEGRAA